MYLPRCYCNVAQCYSLQFVLSAILLSPNKFKCLDRLKCVNKMEYTEQKYEHNM